MWNLAIIAALSQNDRVIGLKGKIPWYLPSDMRHFKGLTTGHTVIMGRETFESIPPRFRPLPNRRNVVLTQSKEWRADGVTVCHSWSEARELTKDTTTFVAGGESVYAEALPEALVLHLTIVRTTCPGDRFFPKLDLKEWRMVGLVSPPQAPGDECPFYYQTWRRRG